MLMQHRYAVAAEADMAHKIKEEVERKKHALFGNLISLR